MFAITYWATSNIHIILKRLQRQLSNALEKLERVHRHAEDKRSANQRTLERLHKEYDEMIEERKENDKELEELRAEAEEVEAKVGSVIRIRVMNLHS
jgi:kinetochore protein Nuf2